MLQLAAKPQNSARGVKAGIWLEKVPKALENVFPLHSSRKCTEVSGGLVCRVPPQRVLVDHVAQDLAQSRPHQLRGLHERPQRRLRALAPHLRTALGRVPSRVRRAVQVGHVGERPLGKAKIYLLAAAHLTTDVGLAAVHVERRRRQLARVQRRRERGLVNELAARRVDQQRTRAHRAEGHRTDDAGGPLVAQAVQRDAFGLGQQCLEAVDAADAKRFVRPVLPPWVVECHLEAACLGAESDGATDAPEADEAEHRAPHTADIRHSR
eukprot:scaffold49904_cov63-Phaeocystis_antarctica.AAC.2